MTKHYLICKCRRCQVEYDIPLVKEAYQLALRALKEHVPAKVDTYIHDCGHDHNYGISEVIGIGFKKTELLRVKSMLEQTEDVMKYCVLKDVDHNVDSSDSTVRKEHMKDVQMEGDP